MGGIERLTFMESKILELGKKQYEKGYQGGNFTPGFIRKETEYGYRAINIALETLIAQGFVEKSVTNTYRDGSMIELDVYKITDKGMEVLTNIRSGSIAVNGKEPPKTGGFKPEPRTYSKPWDAAPKPRYDARPAPVFDVEQSIKVLEGAVRAMAEDIKALHSKLDSIITQPPAQPSQPGIKTSKPASKSKNHRALIVFAVLELSTQSDNVLAEDVKNKYIEYCTNNSLKPKGTSQFTQFLKRLEGEGLVSLRRVGCKNLGIKGHGSRVVVEVTPEGRLLV